MKSKRILVFRGSITLLVAGLIAGCVSPQQYEAERRQRLLTLYPPGATTRADVATRWGEQPATETAKRPSAGWSGHELPGVVQRCLASEQRTGKRIESCERRRGADGLFGLCYCWFYYDSRDRLVDTEWQRSSD